MQLYSNEMSIIYILTYHDLQREKAIINNHPADVRDSQNKHVPPSQPVSSR